MKKTLGILISLVFLFASCKKNSDTNSSTNNTALYFPPIVGTTWQTTTPASLGWNESEIPSLYDYLQLKNTKAFIVLKDGKIVLEKYFGTFIAMILF